VSLFVAFPVCAEPLDVLDPSPRPVLLEFEISSDPSVVGQNYSSPYPATYSASGGVGTVTLAGSEYESFLSAYGGAWLDGVMSGTFSDFTVEIDLTTLEATGGAYGQLGFPAAMVTDVSTTRSGGWILNPFPPPDGPLFCSLTVPGCTPVPAAAYDPQTGALNAVGFDRLTHQALAIDFFSFSGDLRLSEAEAVPALDTWATLMLSSLLILAAYRYAVTRRA
jgi:hypothetical protein